MTKNFLVDSRLKKKLESNHKKYTNNYVVLKHIKNFLMALSPSLPIIFAIYAYIISDGFVYLNDFYAKVGSKNHLFIWTVAATMFVLLLFFYLIARVIYNGLINKKLKERFDENIVFDTDRFQYGYKISMQSYVNDRVIVTIPINELTCKINNKTKRIIFTGNITSQYYTNYKKNQPQGQGGKLDEDFIIYDYFSPSLIEFLKSLDVVIKYE